MASSPQEALFVRPGTRSRVGWDVLLEPSVLPTLFANIAMVFLAVFLVRYGRRHRPSLIFAGFLVGRALVSAVSLLREINIWGVGFPPEETDDPAFAARMAELFPHVIIPVTLLLVYLAFSYPRARFPRARQAMLRLLRIKPGTRARWAAQYIPPVLFLLVVLALEIFATDPSLWHTKDRWPDPDSSFRPEFYLYDQPMGILMVGGLNLGMGLLAVVFARDAYFEEPGAVRQSLTILSLAFCMEAIFVGWGAIMTLTFEHEVYWHLGTLLTASAGLMGLAAAGVMAIGVASSPDPAFRGAAKRYLGLLVIPAVFSLFFTLDALLDGEQAARFLQAPTLIPITVIRFSMPILAAYALLRHGMFNIDVKVKGTLRGGTVATVVGAALFILSESMESRLPVDGLQAGVLAAAIIGITLRPVHALAIRFAERLMPGIEASPDHFQARKESVYRSAVEQALLDGTLSEREERILQRVRLELGLTVKDARRIHTALQGAMPS